MTVCAWKGVDNAVVQKHGVIRGIVLSKEVWERT